MSDTLDAAGLPSCILSSRLRPMTGARRMAGPALCLAGEASDIPGLPIRAVDSAVVPGAVVIVGPGDSCERALVGGNMIAAWMGRGMAGLLVDGMVRDTADYDALPVFARGRSPQNCRGHWRFTATNSAVSLPGRDGADVTIGTGDWILADDDGIAVLPRSVLMHLLEDAQEVGRIERRMRAAIDAGTDRQQVYESHPRFAHVRPARRSGATP